MYRQGGTFLFLENEESEIDLAYIHPAGSYHGAGGKVCFRGLGVCQVSDCIGRDRNDVRFCEALYDA